MTNSGQLDNKDEQQLNLLASKAECGLIKLAYNSEMTILYSNPYFYTLHGYTQEEYQELFGSNALARIHPDDAQRFKASVARQLNMGTALRFEYRVIKKDGSIAWLLIKGQMTANEQRISYLCSCIDITSMKISYQDLARSKQELDVISNNVPGGVAKMRSTDFKLLYANNTFFDLTGYSRLEYEEEFDNIYLGLILPDDVQNIQEELKKSLRNRTPLSMEYRILHKSGQIRWAYMNASYIEESDGVPIFLCVIVDYTVQKEYQKQLELFSKKSQILAELTNERLWEFDVHTGTLHRSGNLEQSFTVQDTIPDFLDYVRDHAFVHVDDLNTFLNVFHFNRVSKKNIKLEVRMKNNIGLYNWYRLQGVVMFDEQGKPYQVIGKTSDIDSSKQLVLKLQEEANHDNLTQLFNTSAIADKAEGILKEKAKDQEVTLLLIDLDRFKIIADHYGRLCADNILSQTALVMHDLFPEQSIGRISNDQFVVFISDTKSISSVEEKADAACDAIRNLSVPDQPDLHITCSVGYFSTKDTNFTFEIMLSRANVALRTMKSRGGNGCEAYGSLHNTNTPNLSVTRRRDMEIKRSYYDHLTGLYSLPAFIIEGEEIIQNKKENENFAIIYLDINSFKIFNANYGFTVGNKILKYFARVLEEEKQEGEICCHIEHDEFACLVRYDKVQNLAMRFTKLKDHFSSSNIELEDYFRLNFTCGVYLANDENVDFASMIDKANYARKATKGEDKVSHYAVYNHNLETSERKHLEIEANIEHALKDHEITPYFQPKYSLYTEKPVGLEVLARWNKPDGTCILPEDFCPILEQNGYIVELDFYIFEQSLKIFKTWMKKGLPLLPISFNISGAHLQTENFIERLVDLMSQYAVPIQYVEIEISERFYVKAPESTAFLLQELCDLGFKIVLDDFGKEHSSINSLKDLPIHGVKLDTTIFHGQIKKEKERIIIKKIIEMAKDLQLFVSSEGVETSLQAEQLKEFGCDIAQGFLYHNPMPASELEEYILSRID